MNRLQIDYPERLPDAMQLSASEFEMEAKMAMAAKLYEMAKISSGAAAHMVGVSRVFFLLHLSRYNVSMMNFDTTELVNDVDFSD